MKFPLVILACLVTTVAAQTTPAVSACGNTSYYGPYGVISSPNYPNNYYDNLNCNYYIYASTNSSLSFTFKSFDVEEGYDFMTISCPSNTNIEPRNYTGSYPYLLEPVSYQWCSQGLVIFQSNNFVVATGFSLDYFVSDEGCGYTVNAHYYGYVYTPYFPSNYGYNQNCYNVIWAEEQSNVHLNVQQFDLENDCNRDWLEISCFEGSPYGPYRYCGSNISTDHYIYGCKQLLLWFHSDGNNNYQGFSIEYNVYPEGASGEATYNSSYGFISSPNYPNYYGNNMYWDYYVNADAESSLSFIFKSFHVEDNFDFVTISCTSDSSFLPQEYSGHALPEPFSISPCSQGKVNFRTDSSVFYSGFSLDFYVSDAGCGTTVYTGNNGYVNSPNWPEFYGYNTNCFNIIWAPIQSTIHLNFRSFSLQGDCNADWLEISCLDNSEYGSQRFCGKHDDHEIYIQRCSQVFLRFHSDDSSNAPGFVIVYTIYPTEACGGLSYFGPSGNISSPNYPGDYYDFLYCDYTIYASTGNSLLFTFDSFNVEEGYDFLTISCPANSSYYEYTGYNNPGLISIPNCSQGLVNFHTDETIVSSGFSLKYFVNTAGCGNAEYYPYNGYVTSPNWPGTYGYNQDCYNVIHNWGGEQTTFYLNFQSFILHSCCSCDWLEISCLDNPDFSPTRYCGYYTPSNTYINDCSQVLLWFHSDGSGNDQGFNIEYTVSATADESDGTFNATRHVLRKGPLKAARKAPKNKTLNVTQHVPSNRRPHAAQNAPTYGKSPAAQNVPRNGKPLKEQNAHRNGKPHAAQYVPRNGKPLAAQNVPSNERPLAAQNVQSNGKLNVEEKKTGNTERSGLA